MPRKYLTCVNAVRRALFSDTQRKHCIRLMQSLLNPNYTVDAAVPWIPFDAMDHLAQALPDRARVFEYGSGGSTLFWLKRKASCVSVEHDHAWYLRMKTLLNDHGAVDLRWIPPEDGCVGSGAPGNPMDYASGDAANSGKNFRRYASQIDQFPDASFDLVVVDGRARPSCLMHSLPKVRIGGMLLLDNSDRPYYLEGVKDRLGGFKMRRFAGVTPGLAAWSESAVLTRQA